MPAEGPPLEQLTRRLSECPPDFVEEEPRDRHGRGTIHVDAVVADLLRDLGGMVRPADLRPFASDENGGDRRNSLRCVLVACWLLHDPSLRDHPNGPFDAEALRFLSGDVPALARLVAAAKLVTDPDRREELARLCLRALNLRPAGETVTEAQDRLTTMSSVERDRVLRATRAAEERARQIREAMRRKAAEEAAAKYGRE